MTCKISVIMVLFAVFKIGNTGIHHPFFKGMAPSRCYEPRRELQLQALEGRDEASAGVKRRRWDAGDQGETCRMGMCVCVYVCMYVYIYIYTDLFRVIDYIIYMVIHISSLHQKLCLVGGIRTPLKNMSYWDDEIPNIWEN